MSLEARGITANHGKKTVVHNADLIVPRGQVSVLIGPNGSGKSTLIRCLAHAHRHYSGVILVDGVNTSTLTTRAAASQISYVPQDNPMPFAFTVAELVGLSDTSLANQNEALETLDLTELSGRSVNSLSGGERQRAALARGMAQGTPYLLFDEPAAHLDLRHQKTLLCALRQRADDHNTGVLLVLHDLNQASAYADNVILIKDGAILASGTPEDVLTEEILTDCYQTNVCVVQESVSSKPYIRIR